MFRTTAWHILSSDLAGELGWLVLRVPCGLQPSNGAGRLWLCTTQRHHGVQCGGWRVVWDVSSWSNLHASFHDNPGDRKCFSWLFHNIPYIDSGNQSCDIMVKKQLQYPHQQMVTSSYITHVSCLKFLPAVGCQAPTHCNELHDLSTPHFLDVEGMPHRLGPSDGKNPKSRLCEWGWCLSSAQQNLQKPVEHVVLSQSKWL